MEKCYVQKMLRYMDPDYAVMESDRALKRWQDKRDDSRIWLLTRCQIQDKDKTK